MMPQEDLVDSAIAEFLQAEDDNQRLDIQAWLEKHSSVRPALLQFLHDQRQTGRQLTQDAAQALADSTPSDFAPANLRTVDLEATTDAGLVRSASVDSREVVRGNRATSSWGNQNHPNNNEPLPKTVGDYRLGRLLGSGGMGRVYEGLDPSGQQVAVKILSPDWSRSPDSIERFRQEGAIASAINHPRCVFVRTAEADNGCPYIVMELMSGETLKDLVKKKGPVPYREALKLIADVAEGLDEAHSHGMIHRDVKPANCYLESSGRVKVGDFGLARSILGDSELTRTGAFVGTPLYASPEQIRGTDLDERTDIYSLCATLFFLLTGRAPFESDNPTQVIARIVSDTPSSLSALIPEIPASVDRLVAKGLSRDPAKRFQSMSELRTAIDSVLNSGNLVVTLGRRVIAIAIDLGLYSLISSAIIFAVVPHTILKDFRSPYLVFGSLPFWFSYLFFQEWLRGATIGKNLLRVAVVDANTLERPKWHKVFVRTLAYIVLTGSAVDLLIWLALGQPDVAIALLLHFVGYALGLAMMLSTFWTRSDHPLLQDWLSGTRVLEQSSVESNPLRMPDVNFELAASLDSETQNQQLPTAFGRFVVRKQLSPTIYFAEDPGLQRNVWIVVQDRNDANLVNVKSTDRVTRLRHIQKGGDANILWDAYLAVDGAPLSFWVADNASLNWESTRSLLTQFCNEVLAAKTNDTLPQLTSLNQVWVTKRGQLVLLDFPLPADPHLKEAMTSREMTSREMLRQIARTCLLTANGPQSRAQSKPLPEALDKPLAVHANKILKQIEQQDESVPEDVAITSLRDQLTGCQHLTSKLGLKHRMIQVFLMCLILSGMYGATLSLSRVGNQIGMTETSDVIAMSEIARRIAKDDNLYAVWKEALLNSETTRDEIASPEQLFAAADEISQLNIPTFHARHDQSGVFQRTLFEQAGISKDFPERVKDWELVVDSEDELRFKMIVPGSSLAKLSFRPERIAELTNKNPAIRPGEIRAVGLVLILALFPILWLLIWDTVFRGGWCSWFAGIRYVDRRSRPAGFLQFAWRSMIVWAPFLTLGLAIAVVDIFFPAWIGLSNTLFGAYLLSPLVFLVITLLLPGRRLYDRWSGVYPVPK
jgi:eukaryotic-like serine/threonine-protein kinase